MYRNTAVRGNVMAYCLVGMCLWERQGPRRLKKRDRPLSCFVRPTRQNYVFQRCSSDEAHVNDNAGHTGKGIPYTLVTRKITRQHPLGRSSTLIFSTIREAQAARMLVWDLLEIVL